MEHNLSFGGASRRWECADFDLVSTTDNVGSRTTDITECDVAGRWGVHAVIDPDGLDSIEGGLSGTDYLSDLNGIYHRKTLILGGSSPCRCSFPFC